MSNFRILSMRCIKLTQKSQNFIEGDFCSVETNFAQQRRQRSMTDGIFFIAQIMLFIHKKSQKMKIEPILPSYSISGK
jgi:hypothetical protein